MGDENDLKKLSKAINSGNTLNNKKLSDPILFIPRENEAPAFWEAKNWMNKKYKNFKMLKMRYIKPTKTKYSI